MARGEKNRATIRSAVLTLAWQENVVYTNQQLQTLRQSASSWPVLWRPTIGHPRSAGTAGTLRTYAWGYGAAVAHLPCMQGVRGSNPLSSTPGPRPVLWSWLPQTADNSLARDLQRVLK